MPKHTRNKAQNHQHQQSGQSKTNNHINSGKDTKSIVQKTTESPDSVLVTWSPLLEKLNAIR